MNSNFNKNSVFDLYVEEIEGKSQAEITEIAQKAIDDFVAQSGMSSPDKILQIMMIAARIGIGGAPEGKLNADEAQLAKAIFQKLCANRMDDVCDFLGAEISENEFTLLKRVGSNSVGLYLIRFILAFAFIDGQVDTEIMDKVRDCFDQGTKNDIFTKYCYELRFADEDVIIQTAKESFFHFVKESGMSNPDKIIQAMIVAGKVGISSKTGELNEKEKMMADSLFNERQIGDMSRIYKILASEVTPNEYEWVRLVGTNPLGQYVLKFILCFAYIDGVMDEEAAIKLRKCFLV